MTLMHVRLELAREKDFPEGSSEFGYEFNVPLKSNEMIDLEEWRSRRDDCTVRRFWGGEDERHGHLTHNGTHWRFHYLGADADEDEAIYKLADHPVLEGDYLTVTDAGEEAHTFRIMAVRRSPIDGA